VSISTTKLSLGLVRAAQGRDAEAADLMDEAIDEMRRNDQDALERWALGHAVEFHRSRPRGRGGALRGAARGARSGQHCADRLSFQARRQVWTYGRRDYPNGYG
jgi:hypothetical protein